MSGKVEELKKLVEEHRKVVVGVLVVLVVLLLLFVWRRSEGFSNFAVDMVAADNPDPTLFKYTGRIRSPAGLDEYDNYYENKLVYPGITPDARIGFEKELENRTFRDSSVAWNEARKDLKAANPVAPVTRNEIEAKALNAESTAANLAIGDRAAEIPARN
jgi:hypothetical protein